MPEMDLIDSQELKAKLNRGTLSRLL